MKKQLSILFLMLFTGLSVFNIEAKRANHGCNSCSKKTSNKRKKQNKNKKQNKRKKTE